MFLEIIVYAQIQSDKLVTQLNFADFTYFRRDIIFQVREGY
jgi:hypothetical protein